MIEVKRKHPNDPKKWTEKLENISEIQKLNDNATFFFIKYPWKSLKLHKMGINLSKN